MQDVGVSAGAPVGRGRDEGGAVPGQGGEFASVFEDFDGGGVAGVDLDRPEGAVADDAVHAEEAAEAAAAGEGGAERFEIAAAVGVRPEGSDAAAVAERGGVEPVEADELAGDAEEDGPLAVAAENDGLRFAFEVFLDVNEQGGAVGGVGAGPEVNGRAEAPGRLDEPSAGGRPSEEPVDGGGGEFGRADGGADDGGVAPKRRAGQSLPQRARRRASRSTSQGRFSRPPVYIQGPGRSAPIQSRKPSGKAEGRRMAGQWA